MRFRPKRSFKYGTTVAETRSINNAIEKLDLPDAKRMRKKE